MNLGEKLRQLRQARNLTQPEVAEAIGIEQSYLSKLENGKYTPSSDVFSRVLDVFKINVGDLVDDLEPGAQNQLRQIPAVAEYFSEQKRLIIGDRRRWLLVSTFLFAVGVALIYAGHADLFVSNTVYSYESAGIAPAGESSYTREFGEADGMLPPDVELMTSGHYRGEVFVVPVAGGSRMYVLTREREIDPWQNKAIASLGVLLMVLGLTGLILEKKLSRYQ